MRGAVDVVTCGNMDMSAGHPRTPTLPGHPRSHLLFVVEETREKSRATTN